MASIAAGGVQAKPSGLITREAARDLSDYQYHVMTVASDTQFDYTNTSTSTQGDAIGVLQNAPAAEGREAEVATEGTSLLYVDGNSVNIAPQAKLGSNSNYHGVAVTSDAARYFAIALEASTADGDLIEVKLVGPQTIAG